MQNKEKIGTIENTKVRTQTANNLRALIVNSKKKISLTRKLKELKKKIKVAKSCKNREKMKN